jgi:hypothetical protein
MYDSLLFLFGVIKEDELLFSEKEAELEVIHVKRHGEAGKKEGA